MMITAIYEGYISNGVSNSFINSVPARGWEFYLFYSKASIYKYGTIQN